jgi:hypothetical protein
LSCEQTLYFVQPRSEKFWNVNKSTFLLFCRAAKNFGIYQQKQLKSTVSCSDAKSTVFCSVAQRKVLTSFRGKCWKCEQALYFVLPPSEKLWNYHQKQLKSTVSCSAAKSTVFCSAAQRKVLISFSEIFGIANKNCILFGRTAENFGIDQQKKLRLIVFVLPCSGTFWYCQQKKLR